MRFSIIMPVYNAGKYLSIAIGSIIRQSFQNFELILIDDGSSDGSANICDEYAAADSRVRVLHRRNGGICNARNTGMAMAKGEYIGFCDHDDEYLPGYLEAADNAISQHGTDMADIVKFNWTSQTRFQDGTVIPNHNGHLCKTQRWTRESDYALYMALYSVVWNGFYKAEFLKDAGLKFDETFRYGDEDFDFMLHALASTPNVWWHEEKQYIHYVNKGVSTSSRCHLQLIDDYLRTIKYELSAFPSSTSHDCALRLRHWLDTLSTFVLNSDSCPIHLVKKSKIFAEYIRTLLPQSEAKRFYGQGSGDRAWKFFLFCARHNLYFTAGFAETLWHACPGITLLMSKLFIRKPKTA